MNLIALAAIGLFANGGGAGQETESAWLDAVKLSGMRSVEAYVLTCHSPSSMTRWEQVDSRRKALIEPHKAWFTAHRPALSEATPPILRVSQPDCPAADRFEVAIRSYSESIDKLEAATRRHEAED